MAEKSKVEQFMGVTGADQERATFFLESSEWDIAAALSSYYEEIGDATHENPTPEDPISQPSRQENFTKSTSQRIATLSNMGKPQSSASGDDDDEDNDKEEGQAFYAGGSEHSGQQVLGPPRAKKDFVAKLFKGAKEHGAEVVNRSQGSSNSVKATFSGTGYILGETPQDSVAVHSREPTNESPKVVELRMWSAGFTVDDGPLRDYNDEENKRFLFNIQRGQIPTELLRMYGGREVEINMHDNHHEDYVPPKSTIRAFTGVGHALGSPAPIVLGQATGISGPGGSAHKSSDDMKTMEENAKRELNVNQSKPLTNVQVRLQDGSRLVIHANQSHTVNDLRQYIVTARPEYEGAEFALMTTFPHAELTNLEQTLEEAKLLNAAIVIKKK